MGPKSAKSAKYRVFCGYTWKTPGIPGKYPATAWVSCRFPQFCLRFCPRPALRLRETREFPEWSTKHPLFSLEISGNAKCWGPSVFLFVCRKTSDSPTPTRSSSRGRPTANRQDLEDDHEDDRDYGKRNGDAGGGGLLGLLDILDILDILDCLSFCSPGGPPAAPSRASSRARASAGSTSAGALLVAKCAAVCGYSIVFDDVEQCTTSSNTSGEWP